MEAMSRSPMYRARRALNFSLQKYTAIMRVSIANNLAYVMEVFFRALLLVVLVFFFVLLWTTTYTKRVITTLVGFIICYLFWFQVNLPTCWVVHVIMCSTISRSTWESAWYGSQLMEQ